MSYKRKTCFDLLIINFRSRHVVRVVQNMYFVYLIKCKDGTIYTGITTDVKRRFIEHKEGKGGHYTRSRGVAKLLYVEKAGNRSLALKREAQIKRWRREEKLNLVKSVRLKGTKG